MKCKTHKVEMKALFTSVYCPVCEGEVPAVSYCDRPECAFRYAQEHHHEGSQGQYVYMGEALFSQPPYRAKLTNVTDGTLPQHVCPDCGVERHSEGLCSSCERLVG